MNQPLPPVDALVLADGVDALPGRLRKRLDAAVSKVAGWTVSVDGAEWSVHVDDATVVTLRTVDGAVRAADNARCTCLLAPACLHRAAVLSAAPVATEEAAGATDPATGAASDATEAPAEEPGDEPAATGLSAVQRAAADAVWSAAGAVLTAGVTGSGVVLRAALLRAAHDARAHGLHHLAAGARQVAAHLQDARSGAPQYRLGTLSDDLRALLLLAHRLRDPGLPDAEAAPLLGTARREYTARGSLRLVGLCSVPVLARSGHAGTATYTVDRDGVFWLVADIYPGDVQRAAVTGDAGIPLGEGLLSHRELARAGLMVTGATASESRQLGAGQGVRAVRSGGATWDEAPLAALWDEPVEAQLDRAFAAIELPVQDRPAGADLLFLRVEIIGSASGGVLAVTEDERLVTLAIAIDGPELAYRDNLRVLAAAGGVALRLIGRPDPARPGVVHALAIAPDGPAPDGPASDAPAPDGPASDAPAPESDGRASNGPASDDADGPSPGSGPDGPDGPGGPGGPGGPDGPGGPGGPGADRLAGLRLPAAWGGHADLGYDRLHRSMITGPLAGLTPAPADGPPSDSPAPLAGDPALRLLRRHLDRTVEGGRAVQAFARGDQQLLRRSRWETGADLLATLNASARPGHRDTFGRLADDDGRRFVVAWLAAAVYEQAAASALSRASWSPGSGLTQD